MSTRTKVCPRRSAVYFAFFDPVLLIFGNDGKNDEFKPQNEFKLEPWINIKIGRHRPQHQPRRPLPGPGQRPDDRA